MNNIRNIDEELKLQIAEDLMIGSIKTSRQTYTELQAKEPQHIAQSYVETYVDDLYNKSDLFWSNIDRTITILTNYLKDAKAYIELESYRPQTLHVAKCLYFTSLSYIMPLVYFGLQQKYITLEHIQQLQVISSDEKGLGLKIAGFNIAKYNLLLNSIPHGTTSTQSASKKRLETIAIQAEISYHEDIFAMMPLLKSVTAKDSNGTTIFTRTADLYAYLAYKLRERRGDTSIDWSSMEKVLPHEKQFKRRTLIDAVSKFSIGKKKAPTGHEIIDKAMILVQ